MEGHDFLPLNSDVVARTKYFRGIRVTMARAASGELFNHDFVDITQAEVSRLSVCINPECAEESFVMLGLC